MMDDDFELDNRDTLSEAEYRFLANSYFGELVALQENIAQILLLLLQQKTKNLTLQDVDTVVYHIDVLLEAIDKLTQKNDDAQKFPQEPTEP